MGFWADTLFFLRGNQQYTRSGFDAAYRSFDHSAIPGDLSGRVYIVTGANSGLGRVVARELAARQATVHLVCRNRAKGDETAADILRNTGAAKEHVIVHEVDLSRPSQIRSFVQEYLNENKQLDALINNAGAMGSERVGTPEGLESTFAVNVLGIFMLTEGLLPVLKSTTGSRVVAVTSAGMLTARLTIDDLQCTTHSFDGMRAYARHKRMQVELTHHWAAAHSGIQFLAVHPGWADTPGVQQSMPSFYKNMMGKLRTPEQGADCILWAATAAAAMAIPNGSFVGDRKVEDEHLLWAGTAARPGDFEKLVDELNRLSKLDEAPSNPPAPTVEPTTASAATEPEK